MALKEWTGFREAKKKEDKLQKSSGMGVKSPGRAVGGVGLCL